MLPLLLAKVWASSSVALELAAAAPFGFWLWWLPGLAESFRRSGFALPVRWEGGVRHGA